MNYLLALELMALFAALSCLPTWLSGKWYAAHGAPLARKHSFVIISVLALVGCVLAAGAHMLELRQARTMLAYAFALLGIVGLLVSAALHAFDQS